MLLAQRLLCQRRLADRRLAHGLLAELLGIQRLGIERLMEVLGGLVDLGLHLTGRSSSLSRARQSRGHLMLGRLARAMLTAANAIDAGRGRREEMVRIGALRRLLRRVALGLIRRRVVG